MACLQLGPQSSRVRVTYRYTGLSESGNRFVTRLTKEAYAAFIEEWKKLIDGYFRKGVSESIPVSH